MRRGDDARCNSELPFHKLDSVVCQLLPGGSTKGDAPPATIWLLRSRCASLDIPIATMGLHATIVDRYFS